jgi:hypothetical protein
MRTAGVRSHQFRSSADPRVVSTEASMKRA